MSPRLTTTGGGAVAHPGLSTSVVSLGREKRVTQAGAEPSDEEFLAHAALGNLAAVACLYDRHASMLLALSLRVVQDRSEAEDILHDAFVTMRDRACHYSHARGSVVAWLVTLVRNMAIDRVRRRHGRKFILQRMAAEEGRRSAENPEALLSAATTRAGVRRALARLPDLQRLTLEVAFFEGLSYSEIADREDVPLGTIKSRAARALAALRAALASENVGLSGVGSHEESARTGTGSTYGELDGHPADAAVVSA